MDKDVRPAKEVKVGGKHYELIKNTARRFDEGKEKPIVGANSTTDKHRRKLEKLMGRMDKPINIPERPKEWEPAQPREFVRNVMGSSAGAGSGEFHVYRAIRKRTMEREAWLNKQKKKSDELASFEERVRENKLKEDAKTAKKRAKRQRRKANMKKPKPNAPEEDEEDEEEEGVEVKGEEGEDRIVVEEEMKEEVKEETTPQTSDLPCQETMNSVKETNEPKEEVEEDCKEETEEPAPSATTEDKCTD